MTDLSPRAVADQLLADFRQEHQLVNLIIKGCIEHRWAVGETEKELSKAMVYNAFETYAVERGIPLEQAEQFCEQHLDELIQRIQTEL
jgi:hypothetical protein